MCVFIDESGRVRETIKLDTLSSKNASIFDDEADVKPTDEFKAFVSRRKPAVIVVGGLSYSTHHLTKNVKSLVLALAKEKIEKKRADDGRPAGLTEAQIEAEEAHELEEVLIPVIYVPDNVARIYQHSLRAQSEFPTQPTTGRYCIGLGRFAQSPIHEFCALGADVSAITFDEDSQNLVRNQLDANHPCSRSSDAHFFWTRAMVSSIQRFAGSSRETPLAPRAGPRERRQRCRSCHQRGRLGLVQPARSSLCRRTRAEKGQKTCRRHRSNRE